jgi:transglutaminase-like putative cysteine protease
MYQRSNTKKSLCLAVLCAVGHFATAQLTFESLVARYPDQASVYLERSETLNISISGDSLRASSDIYEESVMLKDMAEFYSSKKIYGSHFVGVENIRAKTLVPDKKRFNEIEVTEIKKNHDSGDGIFYDDSYYYSFDFPALRAGCRTQLSFREVVTDVRFISGYFFSSYQPVAKSVYTVKTSKGIDLFYKVVNDPGGTVKFEKSEKDGQVVYKWTSLEPVPITGEDHSPPARYYAPHVVCYVTGYRTKSGEHALLRSLDDLHRWYYTFLTKLDVPVSPELAAVVSELKLKNKEELAIVRDIYYWVQDNIKYIAFEQGMRGLIPHDGNYVFEKRYGDCKDMASIIIAMLRQAGIPAYYTWLGTRDIPYRYSEYPSPVVDNHMIATYISPEGRYYFLDATDNYLPFGSPSSMIQGKEALIVFDNARYEVKMVPEVPMEMNQMTDSLWINIAGNNIAGRGACDLSGFSKASGAYRFDRVDKEDIKNYVVRLVGKGNNKFLIDKYHVSHLENKDRPTVVSYEFRLPDYFQKVGNELYLNLNLNKELFNSYINRDLRKTPVELEYKYIQREVVELSVPDHMTIEYLPPNTRYDDRFLSYEISYEVKPQKIVYSKKIAMNYLLLGLEGFESWNTSVQKLSDAYKETIILKEKKN